MVTPARVVGRPPSMPAAPVARQIPVAARLNERQMRLQEIAPRPFAKVGRPEKVTTVGPALATRPPTPATPVPVPPPLGPNRVREAMARLSKTLGIHPRKQEFKYTATVRESGRPTYGSVRAFSKREAAEIVHGRGLRPERIVPGRLPLMVKALRAVLGDAALHPEIRHLYSRDRWADGDHRGTAGRSSGWSPGDGRDGSRPSPSIFNDPARVEPVTSSPPSPPSPPSPANTARPPTGPSADSGRYSPFFHGGMT